MPAVATNMMLAAWDDGGKFLALTKQGLYDWNPMCAGCPPQRALTTLVPLRKK